MLEIIKKNTLTCLWVMSGKEWKDASAFPILHATRGIKNVNRARPVAASEGVFATIYW